MEQHIEQSMLDRARNAYIDNPDGLTDQQLAEALSVSRITAWRYRKALSTVHVYRGIYRYKPTESELELAHKLIEMSED